MSKMSEEELTNKLSNLLGNELREYHEKYSDADYYDLSGYLVGLLKRPQTLALIHSYTQEKCREARLDELDWSRNEVESDSPINVYDKISERIAQLSNSKGKENEAR